MCATRTAIVVSDIGVRGGTADDMAVSAEIWEAAHHARLGFTPEVARKERALAVLESRLRSPHSKFLIAEVDSTCAGMLLATQARENDGAGDPIPGLLHIGYVATHPNHWGKGVASKLLEFVARHAPRSGCNAMQLWVVTSNTRARSLYERHDFIFTGREKIDEFGELIAHYRKSLKLAAKPSRKLSH